MTAVLLDRLSQIYLESLKISDETNIFLVDSGGVILSSQFPDLVGKKIFDSISKYDFLAKDILIEKVKKEFEEINSGEKDEGKLDYMRPNFEDGLLRHMLLSYSAIDFKSAGINIESAGKRWILVVETPAEDALAFMGPFSQNQILGLILAVGLIIFFSLVVLISVKVAHEEAFAEGYEKGWMKEVSKK